MKSYRKGVQAILSKGVALTTAAALVFAVPVQALAEGSGDTESNDLVPVWTTSFGEGGTNSIDSASLSYLEGIYSVAKTSDGKIVAAGLRDGKGVTGYSGPGDNDGLLAFLNEDGSIQKEIKVGGTKRETFSKVIATDDGFVCVGYSTSSDGDMEESGKDKGTQYHAVIAKFDNSGNLIGEVKGFGGTKKDYFRDVIQTADGGFLAVGDTESSDGDLAGLSEGGYRGCLLVKFDKDLNVVWKDAVGGEGSGTTTWSTLQSVIPANDGSGYFAAGYADATAGDFAGLNQGARDAVVVKYKEDGTREWIKTYGGAAGSEFSQIIPDISGVGYVLSGFEVAENGDQSATLTRIDSSGDEVFTSKISDGSNASINNKRCIANGVVATETGYVLSGMYSVGDKDFNGLAKSGEKAQGAFVAGVNFDGVLETLKVADGADSEKVRGAVSDGESLYVYGGTASSDFLEVTPVEGAKSMGFVSKLNLADFSTKATRTYVAPVEAPQGTISKSRSLLHEDAFIQKFNDYYTLTFYFTDGEYEGEQVASEDIPAVYTQDSDGDARLVGIDSYNEKKHVRSITVMVKDPEQPVSLRLFGDEFESYSISIDDMAEGSAPLFVDAGEQDPVNPGGNEQVKEKHFNAPAYVVKQGSTFDSSNPTANQSMMSPFVYKEAHVVQKDDAYEVTFYYQDASVMGSSFYASQFSPQVDTTGSKNFVDPQSSSYDEKTHILSVTVSVTDLTAPISIKPYTPMESAHLYFDVANMTEGTAPTFKEIEQVDASAFESKSILTIGGSGNDSASEFAHLTDGEIVTVGATSSTDQDFKGRADTGSSNAFITIHGSDNELMKSIDLQGVKHTRATSVAAGTGNEFFVSGWYQPSGDEELTGDFADFADRKGADRSGFIAKYNASGERLWIKSSQGNKTEAYYKTIATADGGCIVVSEVVGGSQSYEGPLDLKGLVDSSLVKYSANGDVEWTRSLGVPSGIVDAGYALTIQEDGTLLFAGAFGGARGDFADVTTFGGTFDLFIAQVDSSNGELKSLKTYGGSGVNESIESIQVTADGGYIVSGSTQSKDAAIAEGKTGDKNSSFIAKFSKDNELEWSRTLNNTAGNTPAAAVEVAGGYVMVGTFSGNTGDFKDLSKGGEDAYVAIYNKSGELTSLKSFGGSVDDGANYLLAASNGDCEMLVTSESHDGDLRGLDRGNTDSHIVTFATGIAQTDTDEDEGKDDNKDQDDDNPTQPDKPGNQDTVQNDDLKKLIEEIRNLIAVLTAQQKANNTPTSASDKTPTVKAADGVSVEARGKTLTVNTKTVSAKKLAKAAKKAKIKKSDITSIKLGKKVKTVKSSAFKSFKKLTSVTLGKNVKTIKKNAFKGSKVDTIVVKTKKLTKKSTKGALNNSKVKNIKVAVGKKSANRKYVKKYKKIFG